jgi:hypothetical protein
MVLEVYLNCLEKGGESDSLLIHNDLISENFHSQI